MDEYHTDITAHGAVGDGRTLNTQAIQAAVDAIGSRGGGTVYLPPGTWLTGTVFLRDGVTLELHPAARLLGSPDLADYVENNWGQHIDRTPWHLLVCAGVRDVTITGGTIDGNGPAFWEECEPGPQADSAAAVAPGAFKDMDPLTAVPTRHADPVRAPIAWIRADKEHRPSPMLEVTDCRDVRIEKVHLTNSAGWTAHLHNCDRVWVTGIELTSNLMGPNNDGLDITGCHDVTVSDCRLSCCDDAICLKTTPDSHTVERVTVTNCIIRTKCVALKLGCNESFHDFKQVTFSNCVVYESSRAVGLYTKRGGNMEDVVVTGIVCDTRNPFVCNRPVQVQVQADPENGACGRVRNLVIASLVCRTDGRVILTAPTEAPIENLVLRDLQMIYPTVDDPELLRGRVECGQFPGGAHPDAAAARAVVVVENARNLVLDNLMVTWPATDAAGAVTCPEDWRFPLKAANGMFDAFFARAEFNDDRLPPFSLVWARGVQGGYLSAPTARPSGAAPRYDLVDCELPVRD